jgi:beta-carotene hydroxylase
MHKPSLPKEFTDPSIIQTGFFIIYTFLVFLVPSLLAYWLLFVSSYLLVIAIPISFFLFIIAGQGMHLMGWIGHDGLHFNLSRNRIVSSVIGILFSSATVSFVEMGMALDHWTHHRHTNTEKDPDLIMFHKHKNFITRMVFSRLRSNRHYMKQAYRIITRSPKIVDNKILLPFNYNTIRNLTIFNVVCCFMWLGLYLSLAWFNWKLMFCIFFPPMLFASIISGLRPYIEHNGTGQDIIDNTRTRTSKLWTALDYGGNFHFEHHLYPTVPQWRLPGLHRYLKENGIVSNHIDTTFLKHYAYASKKYQYPTSMTISNKE